MQPVYDALLAHVAADAWPKIRDNPYSELHMHVLEELLPAYAGAAVYNIMQQELEAQGHQAHE